MRKSRRGHIVMLMVIFTLVAFATTPLVAQPDAAGKCPNGEIAQLIPEGAFLLLKDPTARNWGANWRAFRAANPHLDLERKRIIVGPGDTRIPFGVSALLCGFYGSGYEILPTHTTVRGEGPPSEKAPIGFIWGVGLFFVGVITLLLRRRGQPLPGEENPFL